MFTLLEFIGAIGQLVLWGYIADRYKARTALIIGAETVTGVGYIGVYLLHKYFLSASGAEGIILGCTEIPLLIKQKETNLPLFDTTSIHALAAADWSIGIKDLTN